MKRHIYTASICALLGSAAQAQTTITHASFPQAGDVLQISTYIDTTLQVTAASGSAQTWDFSRFYTQSYREDSIQAASTGANFANFPTSDIIEPLISGLGGSAYVDVTNTAMTRIGGGLELMGISFVAPFADPQILQVAPLTMGTSFNDPFSIRFGVNIDSVPMLRTLIDSLAGSQLPQGTRTDSLRVNVSGNRNAVADAFGTCRIFDGTYNVVRQKVNQTTAILVEIRIITLFGAVWFDISPLIASQLPIPLNDTTIYYDYLAEGYKQPIARMNMSSDESQVESVEFKGENPVATAEYAMLADVVVYPNPAQTTINIEFAESVSNYSAELRDMSGRQYEQYQNLNGRTHALIVRPIPHSIYTLSIFDQKGKRVHSKLVRIAQ